MSEGPPGSVETVPTRWQPGQDGGPLNTDEGASDEEEGKEGEVDEVDKKPVTVKGLQIEGYDTSGTVGQQHKVPAPPQPVQPAGAPPDMTFTEISVLDDAACREAILAFVAQHCCYGSRPAKNMTFTKITPMTALHYTLESYAESRSTSNEFKPYRGGPVDGPSNGPAPPPWAIPCQADNLFQDQVKLLEVPHTSHVQGCHRCDSKGWLRCSNCNGRGRVRCGACSGRGYHRRRTKNGTVRRDCGACVGGRRRCYTCGGDGRVTCHICDGYCKLRHYIELKVTYKNHLDDYILEKTDMPDELIRDVGGKPVFEQTLPKVWPITSYPVNDVNDNSQRLVALHQETYKTKRTLMQRQILRAVPVTETEWDWSDLKNMKFWVYGNEKRVYCPDYPHTCCWGCVIL
ncbi:protein SSUH2 homolog [Babylonia areolata]|uniref:protein SSUH2 homolog n=1 Tax=Babylonia areolata TaxID=304850 RepID=UPI003FD14321